MPIDDSWLDTWSADIEQRAQRAKALAQQMAGVSATASTPDSAIRVKVDNGGVIQDLVLGEGAMRMRPNDLAAAILATARRAQADLARRAAAIVDQTIGLDTESGRAVLLAYQQRFAADGS